MPIAIVTLFFAAFCIGTTEFVIAGLLPTVSSDLSISIPVAGYLISVYAIGVAIGGPFVTIGLARFPRKNSILALMVIFILGHVWCAMATSYESLLMARIFVSLTHGSFFGIATVLAVSLAPKGQSGRAVGLLMAGITVANILGVPGGTAIGNLFGWRMTFWAVGAAGVLAIIALIFSLPRQTSQQIAATSFRVQLSMLGNQAVILSLLTFMIGLTGFWTFFTFVAPFLLEITQISAQNVPWVLLIFGLGATFGTILGGRLADWKPRPASRMSFALVVIVLWGVFGLATNPYAMAGLVFILGFAFFLAAPSLINRVINGAAQAPELASTLVASFANAGIAIGAIIGAQVLSAGWGYINLPLVGSVFVALALACLSLSLSLDKSVQPNLATET